MFSKSTVFITGGAGFIGTNLVRRLIDDNKVVVFDNLHRNALSNDAAFSHPNLTFIQGDVLDARAVENAMGECNLVVHLAAIAGVDTVMSMPTKTMKINLTGTMNVVEAATKVREMKRFVDFSTSEVFGSYAFRVHEGDVTSLGPVGEARWTYAVSKLATEHFAISHFRETGFPACSIRPFNIYGPQQVGEGAIHHFIVKALRDEDLIIHNDGGQIRAWCYVDDIIDAILLCLSRDEAIGQVFNIGNPRSVITVHHLAREIIRLTNSKSKIRFVPVERKDVEIRIPNIDRARKLLGFEPKVDLENGLSKTIDWYRAAKSDP